MRCAGKIVIVVRGNRSVGSDPATEPGVQGEYGAAHPSARVDDVDASVAKVDSARGKTHARQVMPSKSRRRVSPVTPAAQTSGEVDLAGHTAGAVIIPDHARAAPGRHLRRIGPTARMKVHHPSVGIFANPPRLSHGRISGSVSDRVANGTPVARTHGRVRDVNSVLNGPAQSPIRSDAGTHHVDPTMPVKRPSCVNAPAPFFPSPAFAVRGFIPAVKIGIKEATLQT